LQKNLDVWIECSAVVEQCSVVVRNHGVVVFIAWVLQSLLDQYEPLASVCQPFAGRLHFVVVQFQYQTCMQRKMCRPYSVSRVKWRGRGVNKSGVYRQLPITKVAIFRRSHGGDYGCSNFHFLFLKFSKMWNPAQILHTLEYIFLLRTYFFDTLKFMGICRLPEAAGC